jgi:hypothetical protein
MKEIEIDEWLKVQKCRLFVAKQYFHHHAFEILNTHKELKSDFISCFDNELNIETRIKQTKTKKTKAIKADVLNKDLRKLLIENSKNEIKLEVSEEKGVFYFSSEKNSIGGFDFAILNHHKNINALRNICFGEIHYDDGLKRWNNFLSKNPEFKSLGEATIDEKNFGKDVEYEFDYKSADYVPLIVGEIQFGNWALAYRDLFKVLKANVQNSVDCLIYVVPTGELESMLSDGIVTFDNSKKIIQDFAKVISVPIWIVGIDIKIN